MKEFVERWNNDPQTADVHRTIPPYENEATAESMALFLTTLKQEYGSAEQYNKAQGAEPELIRLLKNNLLQSQ